MAPRNPTADVNAAVQPPRVCYVPRAQNPAPTASAQRIMPPYAVHGQPVRPGARMPQQDAMPSPGISRYSSPCRPVIPSAARKFSTPTITQTEKPKLIVLVSNLLSTVEDDFVLSLLKVCGHVKSWNRRQDRFGSVLRFCEFDSAEGVLCALRLLNKLSIDGQELKVNVGQETHDYLERYVEKRIESSTKPKESETDGSEKEEEISSGWENVDSAKITVEPPEESKKESGEKRKQENVDAADFGLINDKDTQANKEAMEKLRDMIKERLKNKSLPPSPLPPQTAKDGYDNSNTENRKDKGSYKHRKKECQDRESVKGHGPKSQTGREKERDLKSAKERELEGYERGYGEEAMEKLRDMTKERPKNKPLPPSPPPPQTAKDGYDNSNTENRKDKGSYKHRKKECQDGESVTGHGQKSQRGREKQRDLKSAKERELERYERVRERKARERVKRQYEIHNDEHLYKIYLERWKSLEREREKLQKRNREREKELAKARQWDIYYQERESQHDELRRELSTSDDERAQRNREKEDDLADELKEKEEEEAKKRAVSKR